MKFSRNKRYLTYQNDSAFLWIGETAWSAIKNATDDEWKQYLTDRKNKGYTVMQVFCCNDWAGEKDVFGNKPFLPDLMECWNPVYWREYDKRVQIANDMGFVVMIVGLMEPQYRYPSVEKAAIFARQLTARLMGNFVIYSPSFDSPYMILADKVGRVINESTSLHLITQHPQTAIEPVLQYYDKEYLDFSSFQSGAGWTYKTVKINGKDSIITTLEPETLSKYLLEWAKILYGQKQATPLINLEARYDSELNHEQMQRLPRSCGYWSFLSGAKGYTYGCAGLWNWGDVPINKFDPQASPWAWKTGLEQKSSSEIFYLAKLLNSFKWQDLMPVYDYILNQPKEWSRQMALSITSDKNIILAYLPDNVEITIKADILKSMDGFKWYNPKTGNYSQTNKLVNVDDKDYTFKKPVDWEDAVLFVTQ